MTRLTKPDWFAIAERVLVECGAAGLTIEELTRRAGVTKGSFYHHFRSQSGFVDAFLQHLAHLGFSDVVAEVDATGSALDQLRQLSDLIAEHDPTLEIAVRRWGATNLAVADMLARVDRLRLEFFQRLYERATGDADVAGQLARLSLAVYLGSLQISPPIQGEEYAGMARALERLLPASDQQAGGVG